MEIIVTLVSIPLAIYIAKKYILVSAIDLKTENKAIKNRFRGYEARQAIAKELQAKNKNCYELAIKDLKKD